MNTYQRKYYEKKEKKEAYIVLQNKISILNQEIDRMRGKNMELEKEIQELKNIIKKYEDIFKPLEKI